MKQELITSAMNKSIMESLKTFNDACDDMRQSKYIIAGGKISRLLISIAGSLPLYKTFESLVSGYNFIAALEKAKVRDQNGTPYLKLPSAPKDQICFVFCLLYALDTSKIELKSLLSSFFKHNDSPNIEFSRFCDELIIPFQKNVNGLLTGKISLEEAFAETAATSEANEINNSKQDLDKIEEVFVAEEE